MHGAIVADAFRVPWKATRQVSNFNDFKWSDWTQSVGVEARIENLPSAEKNSSNQRNTFVKTVISRLLGHAHKRRKQTQQLVNHTISAEVAKELIRIKRESRSLSNDQTLRRCQERLATILDAVTQDFRSR